MISITDDVVKNEIEKRVDERINLEENKDDYFHLGDIHTLLIPLKEKHLYIGIEVGKRYVYRIGVLLAESVNNIPNIIESYNTGGHIDQNDDDNATISIYDLDEIYEEEKQHHPFIEDMTVDQFFKENFTFSELSDIEDDVKIKDNTIINRDDAIADLYNVYLDYKSDIENYIEEFKDNTKIAHII